jgi:hypothetical protein
MELCQSEESRIHLPCCSALIKKEITVDKSELLSILDIESRPSKTKSKKRKWREIEAIHDRYKLEKELQGMDTSLEAELDKL